jgi:hypothetical protein
VEAIIKQTAQPQFIDSAYFMEFRFDGGQYALAGKEQFEGHDVLRIEYYPTKLFYSETRRRQTLTRTRKPSTGRSVREVTRSPDEQEFPRHALGRAQDEANRQIHLRQRADGFSAGGLAGAPGRVARDNDDERAVQGRVAAA